MCISAKTSATALLHESGADRVVITTGEARDAIRAALPAFEPESISGNACTGRVLRQSVVAERDQPPFDRVMMDGIAIAFSDYEQGARSYPVQATQAAGDVQLSLEQGKCIEIMTGASLPKGADCIVPVERIAVVDGVATLEDNYEVLQRRFIHARGSDHEEGAELLSIGKRITPMDIAIINSAGLTGIEVSRLPKIQVISTGNELVPAGEAIKPHQIRMSNGPAVIAMLEQHGYSNNEHDHLVDEPDLLREKIGEHLDTADILILSGGVSMGKADFVPEVLKELGVEVVFHKISQRPGKPMWFGVGPAKQVVFALPGNPVSTLVCCRQYVIPALARASAEKDPQPEFAALAQDVTFRPNLTCFLPVRLISSTGGQVLAMPVQTNTSGDFASLSGTDGYVELPISESRFPAGTPVQLHRWQVTT
jgi:molybdopterin molybdotransferase